MAQFNPMSEEEAKKAGLLKAGPAEFEIMEAADKTGKGPNYTPYLQVKLRLWDGDGKEGVLTDRLMYEGGFAFKLRHLCFAVGQGQMYETGAIEPSELVGCRGNCEIKHRDDDFTGRMVNDIKKYIVPEEVKGMARYQNSKAAASEALAGSVTRPAPPPSGSKVNPYLPPREPRQPAGAEVLGDEAKFDPESIPF